MYVIVMKITVVLEITMIMITRTKIRTMTQQ